MYTENNHRLRAVAQVDRKLRLHHTNDYSEVVLSVNPEITGSEIPLLRQNTEQNKFREETIWCD